MPMAIATAQQAMAAKASVRTAGSDSGRINRRAGRTGAGTGRARPRRRRASRSSCRPRAIAAGSHGPLDDGVPALSRRAVISGSMSKRSAVRPRLRATDVRITL